MTLKKTLLLVSILSFGSCLYAKKNPKIIFDKETIKQNYLPDFSYAGYQYGEKEIPNITRTIILENMNFNKPILLKGLDNGTFARIIGVHGNHSLTIIYEPNSYIEFTNKELKKTPSLYQYQLKKRLYK